MIPILQYLPSTDVFITLLNIYEIARKQLSYFQPMIHFFTIKTSENLQIFNIFMGYRSETLVENKLMAYYYYFNKNKAPS